MTDTDNTARDRVLAALEDVARDRGTIAYSELGRLVGLPTRGPHWKAILEDIALSRPRGAPDLAFLVVSKTTNLPQVDIVRINGRTEEIVGRVAREQEACWDYYQMR